ncbi:glycine-rich protein-like [Ornithodoros turicata]|uniref:glycine-rich protein-like n=1 Tax=Ornithodoros turicata TaxID=34597 RepID=UPI003139CCD1
MQALKALVFLALVACTLAVYSGLPAVASYGVPAVASYGVPAVASYGVHAPLTASYGVSHAVPAYGYGLGLGYGLGGYQYPYAAAYHLKK